VEIVAPKGYLKPYLDNIWEEIIKFIRDALEARGCVREIKTVEISIQEFMKYFKSIGLWGLGG
jgi:ABC-type Fe3+ transport system substrate-binding protein